MKIKQIEWQVWNGDPHRFNAGIECDDGPLCLIGEVVKRKSQWQWSLEDGEMWCVGGKTDSLEEAKQQCQVAYENVIREIIATHTEQEAP